ncbi:hypothetical protein DVH24_042829 [Malus domestica]|uniref:Uncharacterized protein n=1 Tax=Malus domestica TaxID=3750 RepID=A0A498I1B5_MALDO|nr:hypothetical protein DVH24_042829 [Malus domestica]
MWFEFVIHKEASMVSQTIRNTVNSPAESLGVGIKNPEMQNFEIPDLPIVRDEEKGLGGWPPEESSNSRNMVGGWGR